MECKSTDYTTLLYEEALQKKLKEKLCRQNDKSAVYFVDRRNMGDHFEYSNT